MPSRVPFRPRELLRRLLAKNPPEQIRRRIVAALLLPDDDPKLDAEAVSLFLEMLHYHAFAVADPGTERIGDRIHRVYVDPDTGDELLVPWIESVFRPGPRIVKLPLPPMPGPACCGRRARNVIEVYRDLLRGKDVPQTRLIDVLRLLRAAVEDVTGAHEVKLVRSDRLSDPLLREVDLADPPPEPPLHPVVVEHLEAAFIEWCQVGINELPPAEPPTEDWGSVAILPLRLPVKPEGRGLVIALLAWSASPGFWTRERLDCLAAFAEVGEELVRQARNLREFVYVDEVSGALSRKFFEHELPLAVARARRDAKKLALCFVDMDDLKIFNTGHGHDGGDVAIRHVAGTLKGMQLESDWSARTGGDEFALVLTDVTLGAAEALAGQIGERLRDPRFGCVLRPDLPPVPVPVTIGGAIYPDDAKDVDELKKRADEALMWGKQHAKGRPTFYGRIPPEERE